MSEHTNRSMTRREFAATAAAAFTIVPRHVLGGRGVVAPSDKLTLAAIGMGRQGMAVTMDLLQRPELQVVAVCDVNARSKNYAEYSDNAMLESARELLGPGHETWGASWSSPGRAQLTKSFSTSLGAGGREPAKELVEAYYAAHAKSGGYRGCTAYTDYRALLTKEKDLDCVYVATPDHWHAPIAIAAMRAGRHVLGQKPMAHSIGEARRMAAVARETGVATSLTVNNPSSRWTRTIAAWLGDGAIGRVREVHNWSSRPYWPQGVTRPSGTPPVPAGLDWNMWVGPAPMRPYHPAYLPFVWRGWYDFGCGSFGDMGCYSFAGLFAILKLTPPVAVEASSSESYEETFPAASIVHLDFPANGGRAPLRLSWYDGGLQPPRPDGLSKQDERYFRHREEGVLYVGEKGFLIAGFNGNNPRVYPSSPRHQLPPPEESGSGPQARWRDTATEQWIAACQGSTDAPAASFGAQGPVTEALLLGCLAQRLPGERLEWDTSAGRVTNHEKASALVDPPYRDGDAW